jgi:hypothetical protein
VQRLLLGIGILAFAATLAAHWPSAGLTSATGRDCPGVLPMQDELPQPRRLTVHRPVPHPALLAAGQLLISVYVLVAQQPPLKT